MIGDVCEQGEDEDNDGFVGDGDNCPHKLNPDQTDIDKDSKFIRVSLFNTRIETTGTRIKGIIWTLLGKSFFIIRVTC